jgi:hypothetical protein
MSSVILSEGGPSACGGPMACWVCPPDRRPRLSGSASQASTHDVILGFMPGIHFARSPLLLVVPHAPHGLASGGMDPGNKCREDTGWRLPVWPPRNSCDIAMAFARKRKAEPDSRARRPGLTPTDEVAPHFFSPCDYSGVGVSGVGVAQSVQHEFQSSLIARCWSFARR